MFNRFLTTMLLVGFVVLFISAVPALAQPVLTVDGECPGFLRAEVTGAPPEKFILLLYAPHEGSYMLPPGHWCYGVTLGLGWRGLRQVAGVIADQNGSALFEGEAGLLACGGFLQTINYPSGGCQISNVVQIPY